MHEDERLGLMARFLEHPKRDFLLAGWGVFIVDLETGSCIPSRLGAELGWPCQNFSFQELSVRLHPEDRLVVIPLWEALSQGTQDVLEVEFRLKDPSDEWHWVQFRAVVLERNAAKVPTLVAGFDREITIEKEKLVQAEKSLNFFERRFWETETLRIAGSVLAGGEMDPSAAVERFLYQSSRFLSYDAAVVWGAGETSFAWLGGVLLTPTDLRPVDSFPELFEASVLQRRAELVTNLSEKCPLRILSEGHQFNGWLGLPLIYQDRLVGYAEFFHQSAGRVGLDQLASVSALADTAAAVLFNAHRFRVSEQEAATDTLTGLQTRRSFERAAAHLAQESKIFPLSLVLLDLDHFKQVNDVWGHQAGDAVLQAVAKVCRLWTREGDLACRWGGEEILILLKATGALQARRAAERLRQEIGKIHWEAYPQIQVTASLGVVTWPSGTSLTLSEWFARVDQSLYQAKSSGRNQVKVWQEQHKAAP